MNRTVIFSLALTLCGVAKAQTETALPRVTMSVADCMRYAVEHNHDVRISQLTQDSRRADRTEAIAAFLPSVDGHIGAQYNFGRAIDPETNTYTNVSTFYNGYSVTASLPVFDGFQRLNRLRAAKAAVLMGHSQMEAQQGELALQVLEACCNVLYYQGTCRMAEEKREQSRQTLRQTQVMAEVGQKSEADVAQMEAQLAADDYELTRQQSAQAKAYLELKQMLNFPAEDSLFLESFPEGNWQFPQWEQTVSAGETVCRPHPLLESARHQVSLSRYQYRQAKGALSPSLSVSAGVNTSFNKVLHMESTGFNEQLKNNMGEYVYASLSIPLFNRLQTVTNIRRQRNNLRIAEEELAKKRDELQLLQLQAETDCEGYRKQALQMQHKVEADSLAYQLTLRKYEEGLSSGIDVQTTSATLLGSRAQLLQCQLMWALKQRLTAYYRGLPIICEQ